MCVCVSLVPFWLIITHNGSIFIFCFPALLFLYLCCIYHWLIKQGTPILPGNWSMFPFVVGCSFVFASLYVLFLLLMAFVLCIFFPCFVCIFDICIVFNFCSDASSLDFSLLKSKYLKRSLICISLPFQISTMTYILYYFQHHGSCISTLASFQVTSQKLCRYHWFYKYCQTRYHAYFRLCSSLDKSKGADIKVQRPI